MAYLRIVEETKTVEFEVGQGEEILRICRDHAGTMSAVTLTDSFRRKAAENWCRERYGIGAIQWHRRGRHRGRISRGLFTFKPKRLWFAVGLTFCFRNPNAAFEFKLRWA